MRWMIIALTILGTGGAGFGQMPSVPAQVERMAELDGWIGEWEGAGWQQQGPDPASRVEFEIHEEIEETLGGLVYLVRGVGTVRPEGDAEPYVVHDALATIHWDEAEGRYEFSTHTAEGHHTVAELERLDDGRLRWGFDIPTGKVRFTIDLSEDRWHELGEINLDGENWWPFLDMTLQRVADTPAS